MSDLNSFSFTFFAECQGQLQLSYHGDTRAWHPGPFWIFNFQNPAAAGVNVIFITSAVFVFVISI